MAKRILGAVRINGKTYTHGQEKELRALKLAPAAMARLEKLGVIGEVKKSPTLEDELEVGYSNTDDTDMVGRDDDADLNDPLPKVAELPAVLAEIDDVNTIKMMARRDQRMTAKNAYNARLAELVGE